MRRGNRPPRCGGQGIRAIDRYWKRGLRLGRGFFAECHLVGEGEARCLQAPSGACVAANARRAAAGRASAR